MTIDTIEMWLTWAIGGLLFFSALLSLIRITLGPSVLDRVVASDVLVSIVVCALGAYAALTDAWTTLPLLISLSLVGFMGSVAVARFVARDRDTPFVAPSPDRLEDDEDAVRDRHLGRRRGRRAHTGGAHRATPYEGPGRPGGGR